jgi:predicted N-acetyltransferase YhbS
MFIETASWNDILPILRANFRIWSPGLSESDYRHYIWSQLQAPWSRQNLRYIVYRDRGETKASCKTYELTIQSRGKTFSVAALAAVFTQERFRGQGLAGKLIEELIKRFRKRAFDGILLYSDIDPHFYESFGFERMGSAEFAILLPEDEHLKNNGALNHDQSLTTTFLEYHTLSGAKRKGQSDNSADTCHLSPGITNDVIADMTRHYARWLRRRPFGVARSEDYLTYKLGRERFVATHSKLGWPEIIVTIANPDANQYGYALTEYSGITMRVLEVIGSPLARQELWQELYRKAVCLGIRRIRGWESVAVDFAPAFSYRALLPEASSLKTANCKILSFERDWGRPMFLPFNSETASWITSFPCPLLELDL